MIQQIDFAFPFIVFFYGLIMTFVLNNTTLMTLAEQRLTPQLLTQFQSHRFLGLICLCVGGLWSLQNLWLG